MGKIDRRRACMALVLILCLAASVSASYALFSSWKTAENNLSVGSNEIEIEEDFVPPSKLEPDTTFRKTVRVKNTGSVPCYVRVFADFSDSEIRDIAMFSSDGTNFLPVPDYQANLPAGWVYDESTCYYYYTEPVQPGESTQALFHSVNVKFPNEQSVREFRIIVTADSVQAAGSDGVGIDDYAAAWAGFLSEH